MKQMPVRVQKSSHCHYSSGSDLVFFACLHVADSVQPQICQLTPFNSKQLRLSIYLNICHSIIKALYRGSSAES